VKPIFQSETSTDGEGATGPLSRYEILEVISGRERSELYRARDTELERIVAIKVLAPAAVRDPALRLELLNAAAAASDLSHPNIAAPVAAGEDRGYLFVISEYIKGKPLGVLLGERRLSSRRAIEVALQIAEAVAEGHSMGLVHGDLTAEHVVVTPTGQAKVLNFGLRSWSRAGRTGGGEPLSGTQPSDAEFLLDVAAIGTLLLEMTSERRRSTGQQRQLTASDGAVAINIDPDVPEELSAALRRALAAGRGDHCGSAAALAAELAAVNAILEERSKATAPERTKASWRLWPRESDDDDNDPASQRVI
jgi:serine/threonine-protein kinase